MANSNKEIILILILRGARKLFLLRGKVGRGRGGSGGGFGN